MSSSWPPAFGARDGAAEETPAPASSDRTPLGPDDPADPAFGELLATLTVEDVLHGAEDVAAAVPDRTPLVAPGSADAPDAGGLSGSPTGSRGAARSGRSGRILRAELGGTGETYAAWHVTPETGSPFALRVLRRTDAPPRAMEDEVAAMALVPAEVGTTALAFDASGRGVLGRPFIAQRWVPGRTVPVSGWDDALLAALARTAAQLHRAVPDTGHGPVSSAPSDRAPVHDLLGEFRSARRWWTGNHPETTGLDGLDALGPRVDAYVAARTTDAAGGLVPSPLGTALIHGDLVAVNIAVEGTAAGPRCRLLDWEWAEFSDPAKDLSLIGGTVAAAPWYAALDDDRRSRFVAAYLDAAGRDAGLLDQVLERCNAWQAYDRYTMMRHCRLRAEAGQDPDGVYARSEEELATGLDRTV